MKHVTAYSILMSIATLTAVTNWLFPAGNYVGHTKNTDSDTFTKSAMEQSQTLPAIRDILGSFNVKIPLKSFTPQTPAIAFAKELPKQCGYTTEVNHIGGFRQGCHRINLSKNSIGVATLIIVSIFGRS